ncbi:hypothetical protein GCM10010954_32780 [Halobacillus andaensis]|uniref:Uncharacterized protein n=1 Tax=Halobacillus andaensis TaxID=1176239 RepID=A0A917B8Z2_HALAA|nr:hypothetical protein GCM10010954_32780 [Halobacillus andaensis]
MPVCSSSAKTIFVKKSKEVKITIENTAFKKLACIYNHSSYSKVIVMTKKVLDSKITKITIRFQSITSYYDKMNNRLQKINAKFYTFMW